MSTLNMCAWFGAWLAAIAMILVFFTGCQVVSQKKHMNLNVEKNRGNMRHFQHVYFDALRINLITASPFHGNLANMTENGPFLGGVGEAVKLPGVFGQALQRVAAMPSGSAAQVLSALITSLVDGGAFNLELIEQLPGEADQYLCLALFEYCMNDGLTEEERSLISQVFSPFVAIHTPGIRH